MINSTIINWNISFRLTFPKGDSEARPNFLDSEGGTGTFHFFKADAKSDLVPFWFPVPFLTGEQFSVPELEEVVPLLALILIPGCCWGSKHLRFCWEKEASEVVKDL